jgi:hypothetical protein
MTAWNQRDILIQKLSGGKRLLSDKQPDPELAYPALRRIESGTDIFRNEDER